MQLATARLRLDLLRAQDAEALFACRADPAVARFQGWCPSDVSEVRKFIEGQPAEAAPAGWFQRAIRLRTDGRLIGDLGLNLPQDRTDAVEFGISIAPAWQGQGYASEVSRGVFDHVFGQLHRHRIRASVDPRNLASVAMLRALGMRQEAHHRQSLWLHGEWVDDVIFALLASEWQAHSSDVA
jgi:RimJ/RimL family protein N-acetyltransferase